MVKISPEQSFYSLLEIFRIYLCCNFTPSVKILLLSSDYWYVMVLKHSQWAIQKNWSQMHNILSETKHHKVYNAFWCYDIAYTVFDSI